MRILFKLIAQNFDNLNLEIVYVLKDKKTFSKSDVISFFSKFGLDDCSPIKFILDIEKETMNDKAEYNLIEGKDRIIYIICLETNIKKKLYEIFTNEIKEKDLKEISKPLPMDEIKITQDVVEKCNKDSLNLFYDEDFRTLIKIYKNNPEMFSKFSYYINSGNVIVDSEKFDMNDDKDFSSELEEIKKLDIGKSDEEILNSLKKFRGHYNLTLRFLLYNNEI